MKNKMRFVMLSVLLIGVFALSACATPGNDNASSELPESSSVAETTPAPTQGATDELSTQAPESSAATPELPAEAAPVTLTMVGEITEMLDEEDRIRVVSKSDADTVSDVVVNLSDDTIVFNAQTQSFADDDSLKVGDQVQVTISTAMTRSIPPMANGFLVVTNLPDNMMGLPIYTLVEEVTPNDDGSVTVLNQNQDTYVTVGADLVIPVHESDGEKEGYDIAPADIKQGDLLLTWYDVVALSYPAQAGATQAMLIVND